MTSLDLRAAPPRSPRAELASVVFLPRSIDKVRASLPGGDLGSYRIAGFSAQMLETLGISLESFTDAVRAARNDADVAAFISAESSAEGRERWNAFVNAREPLGNREEAYGIFPWLRSRPDLVLALDVLAEDDVQTFK